MQGDAAHRTGGFGRGRGVGREVGVEAFATDEFGTGVFVFDELVGLHVAGADAGDVARQDLRLAIVLVEVGGQLDAVAGDATAEFLQGGKVFDDLVDLCRIVGVAIADTGEHNILGAELEEDAVELLVVVHVLLALFAFDAVERRLGDVDVTALDQALHLTIKEGQQQSADVGAVHIGVRHDDDLVVTGLGGIEATDRLVAFADAGAAGGDQGADFLVGEHLVDAGLLGVNEFAAQREDGLETTVAALFGGAAGGVALDNVELGQRGITLGAVGQFTG